MAIDAAFGMARVDEETQLDPLQLIG